MAVLYSYDSLSTLLAVNVATLIDGSPRLVEGDSWYQYDAGAVTGGYAPAVGAGRWFRLSGFKLPTLVAANSNAIASGSYFFDSASDITLSLPNSSLVIGMIIELLSYANTGVISIDPISGKINGVSGLHTLVSDRLVRLWYSGVSQGWKCLAADVIAAANATLLSFYSFVSGNELVDSTGSKNFTDIGTTPLTYTTGFIGGTQTAFFDNASNGYRLEQADTQFNVAPSQVKTFTFLVNANSAGSPYGLIITKASVTFNPHYSIEVLNATTIRFTVTTSSGTFFVDATVTAAYNVLLGVRAEINTLANTITLQVDDATTQGTPVSTSISGTFSIDLDTDPLVIGEQVTGSQILARIGQIRFWSGAPLSTTQKNTLWNSGAFS